MNFRLFGSIVGLCFAFLAVDVQLSTNHIWAQASTRNVDQPGTFNKYLTPGVVDRWIFSGKENQLIFAAVRTTEFDAILKLVQVIDEEEHLLLEIDDEGPNSSNANLAFRLPADGQYRLLVHGFEFKGGGNYTITLEQHQSSPLQIDVNTSGALNDKGQAWYHVSVDADTFVTADLIGAGVRYQLRDSQGVPLNVWANLARFEKPGEYYIQVEGNSDQRFEVQLRPAARAELASGAERNETLTRKAAQVFDLVATDSTFGLIELEVTGTLWTQFVPANPTKSNQNPRLSQTANSLKFLDVPSKGKFRRYAMIWDGTEPYQLRLVADRGASVRIRYLDPRMRIKSVGLYEYNLPVGSVQFYSLQAEQGHSLTITCNSDAFDSELRLYDASGQIIAADDDGGGGFNARLRHLPFKSSELTLAVASRGDGGGGPFSLNVEQDLPLDIPLAAKISGKLEAGEPRHLAFQAKADQKIIFHLHGDHENVTITLLNSNGVQLTQVSSGQKRDAVLVHDFTEDENYLILIAMPTEGAYQFRAIQAD